MASKFWAMLTSSQFFFSKAGDLQDKQAAAILDSLADVPKLKSQRSTFSTCLYCMDVKVKHGTVLMQFFTFSRQS